MDPAVESYLRLAIYLGTAAVLLRVFHLLVLVPVMSDRELSEAQVRVLSAVGQVTLVIFALAHGFQVAGEALHVDALYNTAEEFVSAHLKRIVSASVQAAVVKSVGSIGGAVPLLGFPAKAISQMLTRVLDRLYDAGEAVAVVLALLRFGHNYAMSTLFPFGMVFLLVPGMRYAGAFLVAAAIALWLVLPATLVGLIMPLDHEIGVNAEPPLGFFPTALPLLFPLRLIALPPAIPVLIELWNEFFDWYVDEVLLWLYLIPAISGMAVTVSMVAVLSTVGGGRLIHLLRRMVKYVLPVKGLR